MIPNPTGMSEAPSDAPAAARDPLAMATTTFRKWTATLARSGFECFIAVTTKDRLCLSAHISGRFRLLELDEFGKAWQLGDLAEVDARELRIASANVVASAATEEDDEEEKGKEEETFATRAKADRFARSAAARSKKHIQRAKKAFEETFKLLQETGHCAFIIVVAKDHECRFAVASRELYDTDRFVDLASFKSLEMNFGIRNLTQAAFAGEELLPPRPPPPPPPPVGTKVGDGPWYPNCPDCGYKFRTRLSALEHHAATGHVRCARPIRASQPW